MTPDPARVRAILETVAAEEIAPHFGKLKGEAIRTKSSPNDLVTVVDEKVERTLRSALVDLAPGSAFIGEEAATANPAIVKGLGGAGRYWVVDPLDGTRNFVRGVEQYGLIVAFVENGRTIMGWIHDIPNHRCVTAVTGEGVDNLGPVAARPAATPPFGLRSVGWLRPQWSDRLKQSLKANTNTSADHCSAYAYLKLARGEFDFKLTSRVHPWDHAAGVLILAEAGGAARWLDDGAPYAPGETLDRPFLTAAPGRDWDALATLILN